MVKSSSGPASKPLRVGINGFGRIGRAVARILVDHAQHEVVQINDLNPDIANLSYLLKYDTNYGRLAYDVRHEGQDLILTNGPFANSPHGSGKQRRIRVSHERDIAKVDWKAAGVDVVIEATGVKQNEESARALIDQGLRVLVTNACPTADFTLIFGVTDTEFNPEKHRLVSTSICDANACAPVLKALHEAFGVSHGFITSLHPWLSYQNLMDGASRSQAYPGATYSHYALGRSSVGTLIPKPTTAVSACERVLPELAGRLKCFSYRVPTQVVTSADMTLTLERPATERELADAILKAKARQDNPKVFRVTDEPLISVDYLGDEHSAIVDTRWMMVNNGTHVKVVLWYDNEWGYSSRVVDSVDLIARRKA